MADLGLATGAGPSGPVTVETTQTTYEVSVDHTLLYKGGLFLLSLLLVIVLALNLTAYDDIGDGSGNDGIDVDTANSYAGITRVALGFAVAYFIYRAIILIIDPKFTEKFVSTSKSLKKGLTGIKTGLSEFTPNIPKVSIPSMPSFGIGSSSKDSGRGYKFVDGVPQII